MRLISSSRAILTLLILTLAGLGFAQNPLQTEPTPTPAATPTPLPVPPERASPRATIHTFIMSLVRVTEIGKELKTNKGDEELIKERDQELAMAVSCLDLSGISELVRDEQGPNLAIKLKDAIDKLVRVQFDQLPEKREEDYFIFWPDPEIVLNRQDNGQWLFSGATVAAIPEMFRDLESRELAAGVEVEAPKALTRDLWLRSLFPERLRHKIFILEHWQWLVLTIIIVAGVVLDRILIWLLQSLILTRYRHRLRFVKPEVLNRSLRPFGLLVMALVWRHGLSYLGLPPEVLTTLMIAVEFVVTLAVVLGAYRLVDVFSGVLEQRAALTASKFDDLLVPLFRKSLKVIIGAFGIVSLAQVLSPEKATTLLTGLGLGGLAFALAAQDTISNLFGSLTVILDRPFNIGDWVVIGDVEGNVVELGIRSTRIRTFYNSMITVPNSMLIKASVDNLGARRYRRWKTMISIAYDTPPDKIEAFCEGIRELVRRHPYTRKDYFHVYLNAFAASSLDILLYVFHETPEWSTELRERHRLALDILRLAQRLGIEFAFPTQTIYMKRGGETLASTEPPDRADAIEGALDRGRREARGIVGAILGADGAVPPPVTFSIPAADNRGEDADGEQ